jgi:branched-chain amino acid transport system permease protein
VNLILQIVGSTGGVLIAVVGLAIILGLMNVINLAQTGLMAVGVYGAVSATNTGAPFWLAVICGAALAGVAGLVVERLVIRRLYARPLDTILATWGISLILVQGLSWIYGPAPKGLNTPVNGSVVVGGAAYEAYRLIIVLVAFAIVLALAALTRYTRVGLRVRMVMDNEPLARAVGINTTRVQQATFVLGAALAGAGGALLGPVEAIVPNYAAAILVPAFLAVLLSGRTLTGLVVACAALSIVQVLFANWANETYATVVVILVAVALLRVRPEGLVWRRA